MYMYIYIYIYIFIYVYCLRYIIKILYVDHNFKGFN